eukprot:TRINITY_DN9750_c0_g1_i1.p1 TRINITY_DN9750_c0_g1~~TRINITY_DN9750_c0_g1_i1.p1  ORF type:complete len:194 (+),score=51.57 TRINITY_DN9750_c0_g1_i1:124-705(+)
MTSIIEVDEVVEPFIPDIGHLDEMLYGKVRANKKEKKKAKKDKDTMKQTGGMGKTQTGQDFAKSTMNKSMMMKSQMMGSSKFDEMKSTNLQEKKMKELFEKHKRRVDPMIEDIVREEAMLSEDESPATQENFFRTLNNLVDDPKSWKRVDRREAATMRSFAPVNESSDVRSAGTKSFRGTTMKQSIAYKSIFE